VAEENIKKVRSSLDELYDEYAALALVEASSTADLNSNNQGENTLTFLKVLLNNTNTPSNL
jgi:hypothetical protein